MSEQERVNPIGEQGEARVETDLPPLVQRLVAKADEYDRKRKESKQAEDRDGADYSWTWNFYEGKARAYRDAASMALSAERSR